MIAEDLKIKKKKAKEIKHGCNSDGAGISTAAVEVVATANTKVPAFSGKHGDDWTIWEMKMTAHLMDKGLDVCLEQDFESKFPTKEIGPFKNNEKKLWN